MTITAPAEIDVPREFVRLFLTSAQVGVMGSTDGLDGVLSFDGDRRSEDEALISSVQDAIAVRVVMLRAVDNGEPVALEVLRGLAKNAWESVRDDVFCVARDAKNAAKVAEAAALLRDFSAWLDERGLLPAVAVSS
jgi:hypothetical protein